MEKRKFYPTLRDNFTIISINEVYFFARTNKTDENNGCMLVAHLKERMGMVDTDDKRNSCINPPKCKFTFAGEGDAPFKCE